MVHGQGEESHETLRAWEIHEGDQGEGTLREVQHSNSLRK